ncbi:hypothetical protein BYT27DRAFT_7282287 [Phlegmacium glaucopus]|nr:hypothetical protein BYT27DRAFT_7282287 [Phlegmacium glaucopus]
MGGAGKLAGSPSRSGRDGSPVVVVVAKEGTIATWNLQRRTDWVEIKQPIVSPNVKPEGCWVETGFLKPNLQTFDMFYLTPSTFLIKFLSILLAKTIILSSIATNSTSAVTKSKSTNKSKLEYLHWGWDSSLSGPVPHEFDEEDEDFVTHDVDDDNGSGSSLQVPTTRHHDETSTSRGTSHGAMMVPALTPLPCWVLILLQIQVFRWRTSENHCSYPCLEFEEERQAEAQVKPDTSNWFL